MSWNLCRVTGFELHPHRSTENRSTAISSHYLLLILHSAVWLCKYFSHRSSGWQGLFLWDRNKGSVKWACAARTGCLPRGTWNHQTQYQWVRNPTFSWSRTHKLSFFLLMAFQTRDWEVEEEWRVASTKWEEHGHREDRSYMSATVFSDFNIQCPRLHGWTPLSWCVAVYTHVRTLCSCYNTHKPKGKMIIQSQLSSGVFDQWWHSDPITRADHLTIQPFLSLQTEKSRVCSQKQQKKTWAALIMSEIPSEFLVYVWPSWMGGHFWRVRCAPILSQVRWGN